MGAALEPGHGPAMIETKNSAIVSEFDIACRKPTPAPAANVLTFQALILFFSGRRPPGTGQGIKPYLN